MPTQRFKIALNNAKFPFLYASAGRSVLQPGLDVAPRTNMTFSGGSESFDYNLIQLLYCENVLPVAEGLLSVGYEQLTGNYVFVVNDFDQALILRDANEYSHLCVPGRGMNYVFDPLTNTWNSLNAFVWDPNLQIVSKAHINGTTYICYEKTRIIEYSIVGPAFTNVTGSLVLPVGYTMADIVGICSASNYLLAYTATEILWSSLLNPLDFASVTGKAGKQTPVDLKGPITAVVGISGGFIVYTTANAVAAFFTNNADIPFSFREVGGSGGVAGYEQVTGDSNELEHYTYSSSGLQVVSSQRADTILPDAADFLANQTYEYWDPSTKQLITTAQQSRQPKKLQLLDNRYLFVSYGVISGEYRFALVYDTALKRWGKLQQPHTDVVKIPAELLGYLTPTYADLRNEYAAQTVAYNGYPRLSVASAPIRTGYALLRSDGTLNLLITDPMRNTGEGVAIFGHVQVARSKTVTFQSCALEGLVPAPAPEVAILGSLAGDGKTRIAGQVQPLAQSGPEIQQYRGRLTYENFDVAVEGKFLLSTVLVETTVHGSR